MVEKIQKESILKKIPRRFFILFLISIVGLVYWYFFEKGRVGTKGQGQENTWMVNNFKPTAINGSIMSIEKAGNFQTIRIKNYNDVLSYGVSPCKENQELLNFIAIGDSVIKQGNAYTLTIIKKGNVARDFNTLYCP